MACKYMGTICLRVGERKPYGFNLTSFAAKYYEPDEIYVLTERVRPREREHGGKGPTGLEYEVTTAGQTAREPTWPTTVGATVTSGTATFTARAISNSSLAKTIVDSSWVAPVGINTEGAAVLTTNGEQKTSVFLEAVAAVSRGEVVNTIEFSDGHIEEFALKVSAK